MVKFKTVIKKTWVFAAAAALIAGSSTVMAFTLENNVPKSASENVVPVTTAVNANIQVQTPKSEAAPEYSVIDRSKSAYDLKDDIVNKLKLQKDMTPEKIEENCKRIISNMIPGEKDITAGKAAAYAADILKKAYGVNFKGYTANATFSRNPIPYYDGWTVIFHAPQETRYTKRYCASVDSVTGKMLDASCFDTGYGTEISKDLDDPAWKDKAEQLISVLVSENVSITGSKVVRATPETGVTVVCELSDGSAFATRLTGENKEAAMYICFTNGYDGSLDDKPVTGNGVG
jgi:hypothetical protein